MTVTVRTERHRQCTSIQAGKVEAMAAVLSCRVTATLAKQEGKEMVQEESDCFPFPYPCSPVGKRELRCMLLYEMDSEAHCKNLRKMPKGRKTPWTSAVLWREALPTGCWQTV